MDRLVREHDAPIEGRLLTASDREARNVLVDRPRARFLWGDRPAVGRRFRAGSDEEWDTVASVLEDVRFVGPDDRRGFFELIRAIGPDAVDSAMDVMVRVDGDPASIRTRLSLQPPAMAR